MPTTTCQLRLNEPGPDAHSQVAITEEQEQQQPLNVNQTLNQQQLPTMHAAAALPGQMPVSHARDQPENRPSLTTGGPGQPSSSRSPSDDDNDAKHRSLHTRFMHHLNRNVNAVQSVLAGNVPVDKLPVKLREFGSLSEAQDRQVC